jgi:hypothetical protein
MAGTAKAKFRWQLKSIPFRHGGDGLPQNTLMTNLDANQFQLVPNVLLNEVQDGSLQVLDIAVYAVLAALLDKEKCLKLSLPAIGGLLGLDSFKVAGSLQRLEERRHIWWKGASICLLTRVANGMVEWVEAPTTKSRRQEELEGWEEVKAQQPRFRKGFSA